MSKKLDFNRWIEYTRELEAVEKGVFMELIQYCLLSDQNAIAPCILFRSYRGAEREYEADAYLKCIDMYFDWEEGGVLVLKDEYKDLLVRSN